MKKWILAIAIVMCLGVSAWGNGFNISYLGQENQGQQWLRGGYIYGSLEAFIGIEIEDNDDYEVGFLLHSRDIVEPDSVAFLSPLMLSIFDEDMVVTGYTGARNVNTDLESFSGAIFGIDAKAEPDSPVSIRAEVHYDNTDDEQVEFYFGLSLLF